MSVEVGLEIEYTPGCCGVKQITSFSDPDEFGNDIEAEGATLEEAYKNLFDEFYGNRQKYFGGAYYTCSVVQMWFVKKHDYQKKDNEEYEAECLMKLVEQIPGVLCLGEFRNVNSGNLIKGYQWAV